MARKRFGQLSKKRKAKIRARAKNEGLTKKQVRKQFNAKRDSNKDKLSASKNPFGTKSKIPKFVAAPAKPKTKPTANPFGTKSKIPKFVAARAQRTAPATTTQSQLQAAGYSYEDLMSGDITVPTPKPTPAPTPRKPAAATTTQSQLQAAGYSYEDLMSGDITVPTPKPTPTPTPTNTLPSGSGPDTLNGGDGIDDIPQKDPENFYPDLPAFLKNNATYLSGASAGGIRRRRSRRSKLGINAMGTNQLKRNFRNMLSIGGINI